MTLGKARNGEFFDASCFGHTSPAAKLIELVEKSYKTFSAVIYAREQYVGPFNSSKHFKTILMSGEGLNPADNQFM